MIRTNDGRASTIKNDIHFGSKGDFSFFEIPFINGNMGNHFGQIDKPIFL